MTFDVSLTTADLVQMFQAGHASLKSRVEVVNGLNVFPVPDGDTGTNMELSLSAGLKSMEGAKEQGLHAALQSLSTGLLMGARGNSGVILSQLLRGFATLAPAAERLDVATFSQALTQGVEIAYRAVAKPVEGTILTVAREAASAGKKSAKTEKNLGRWLDVVLAAAETSLAKTPSLLPVLRHAGVVDSGGQGLVFIFEGFRDFVRGTEIAPKPSEKQVVPELHLDDVHHEDGYGYCTEVLIRTEATASDHAVSVLRERLGEYGDSLLVVGAEALVKVHVHTLHPGRVMEDALEFGPLVKIKVDNMSEQFEAAHGADRASIANHGSGIPTAEASEEVETEPTQGADEARLDGGTKGSVSLVAVAAGDGIVETFTSLGVDIVIQGGQTMNPSTEEIVQAVRSALNSTHKSEAIILPNNKNIVMAAEQAKDILGDGVYVVPTMDIPQGMAAVLAYLSGRSVSDNLARMKESAEQIMSAQIVQAVRDSVYEDLEIQEGQYLVFVRGHLEAAYSSKSEALHGAVEAMWTEDAELLTVIYGAHLDDSVSDDVLSVTQTDWPSLQVEVKSGGQPVYDYILSLE